ncbi:MAG: GntP family permease [Peptococcaceae bacterium]
MFDVIILPLSLLLFAYLAFQKWSAVLIGPLVSIIVIILAKLPLFESMLGPYMESSAGYMKNFYLVFLVGALFGAVYQETKGAESIAHAMVKLTKGKYAAPLIMTITGLLTFGGISGFVIFFAMYPITLELFRSSNITRRLIPATISAGCWTWSMNSPGTPAIQNIIPMRYLGTSSMAAPITGTISGLVQFGLIFLWLEYRARKLQGKGEGFSDAGLAKSQAAGNMENQDLPKPLFAIIPPIVILVLFNVFKVPVEGAVMIGTLLAMALFWKHGKSFDNWIQILNKGGVNSCIAILNTALVVGFAGVVRETPGFMKIIDGLKEFNLPPLVFVAITVAIAAGAAGSASGGLGAAFEALKSTYAAMGVKMENVHRVSAIAAGTLDTLPHQGAQITLLAICGMTHKEAYWDIFITQIIIPLIALAVIIPLMAMGL